MVLDLNLFGMMYLTGMDYLSLTGGPGAPYVPPVFSYGVVFPVVKATFTFPVTDRRL